MVRANEVLIAAKARRYWELTRLIGEARRAADALRDELAEWIATTGEPIDVEGLPLLRLAERRTGRIWDVKALAEREPREYARLLDLGCLTVQEKVTSAQLQAGNLSGLHRRFSWETHTTTLVFDPQRGSRRSLALLHPFSGKQAADPTGDPTDVRNERAEARPNTLMSGVKRIKRRR